MASDPELNSLSRFRKQSQQFVLEEYSHCEVPAGCGGVVLRWRNPFTAVPLTLFLYTPVSAPVFLDGVELRTGRVDIVPGKHVVAFILENANLSSGLIVFAAVHLDPQNKDKPWVKGIEAPLHILTMNDNTWKCTLHRPETEDWQTSSFDDRDWIPLTRASHPQFANRDLRSYRFDQCLQQGAMFLGLPIPTSGEESTSLWKRLFGGRATGNPATLTNGTVWIRKVFDVPFPRLHKQS